VWRKHYIIFFQWFKSEQNKWNVKNPNNYRPIFLLVLGLHLVGGIRAHDFSDVNMPLVFRCGRAPTDAGRRRRDGDRWWRFFAHNLSCPTKGSHFSQNQCFQSGHYQFSINGIEINNSAVIMCFHMHPLPRTFTQSHTQCVLCLLNSVSSWPSMWLCLFSNPYNYSSVFNGIIVIYFMWHTGVYLHSC